MGYKRIISLFTKIRNLHSDPYRIGAYNYAINQLSNGTTTGIGKKLMKKIRNPELAKQELAEMRAIRPLAKLPGFSSKFLQGKTVKDIEQMSTNGTLTRIQEISFRNRNKILTKIPRNEVERIARDLIRDLPGKKYIVGSFRRQKSYSGDIDILIIGEHVDLRKHPRVHETLVY